MSEAVEQHEDEEAKPAASAPVKMMMGDGSAKTTKPMKPGMAKAASVVTGNLEPGLAVAPGGTAVYKEIENTLLDDSAPSEKERQFRADEEQKQRIRQIRNRSGQAGTAAGVGTHSVGAVAVPGDSQGGGSINPSVAANTRRDRYEKKMEEANQKKHSSVSEANEGDTIDEPSDTVLSAIQARDARYKLKMQQANAPGTASAVATKEETMDPSSNMSAVEQAREARYQRKMQQANAPGTASAIAKKEETVNAPSQSIMSAAEQAKEAGYQRKITGTGTGMASVAADAIIYNPEPASVASAVGARQESPTSPAASQIAAKNQGGSLAQTRQRHFENKMRARDQDKSNLKEDLEEEKEAMATVPGASMAIVSVSSAEDTVSSKKKHDIEDGNAKATVPGANMAIVSAPSTKDGIHEDSQREMMIEATLVDENDVYKRRQDLLEERQYDSKLLVHAEAVEGDTGLFGRRHNRCMACLFFVAIAGLGLGLGLGLGGSDDAKEQKVFINVTAAPSPPPTSSPTMAPTPFLFDGLPDFSKEALRDPTSPQTLAYQWVRNDPLLQEYSDKRLLQRFALASIYYSTGGDAWKNRERLWLSYEDHECTWWTGTDESAYPEYNGEDACWENREFKYLTLWDNGLVGTLPPELGLLTSLMVFDFAKNFVGGTFPMVDFLKMPNLTKIWWDTNPIVGSLPTEIGLLSNLLHIGIYSTSMTGTLPTELGNLSLLEMLEYFNNNLSGSIPTELGMLARVTSFSLFSNNLSGKIPTELGMLESVTLLELDDNQLTGTIPTELASLPNLKRIFLNINDLEGSIEGLNFVSSYLYLVNLEENPSLSGTIPSELCDLEELAFNCTSSLCGCECDCTGGANYTNMSLPFSGSIENATDVDNDFNGGGGFDDNSS